MNCKHKGDFVCIHPLKNGSRIVIRDKDLYDKVMNCIKSYDDAVNGEIPLQTFEAVFTETIEAIEASDDFISAVTLLADNCELFREAIAE